jgi:serine/threonine protein kinase
LIVITSDFSWQILLDKKYGRAVDWWAFGVLIYQMLLQQSPFRGEDEDEIYDAILADEPLYPIHMPRDSVSILQKLLTREPELRLGSGPTDAQEIMSHPFFKNINWEDIYHKRVPPPFLPTIKGKADTSNFDSEFTSVTPVLTPVQSVLTQGMQEEFRGFSYTADFVWAQLETSLSSGQAIDPPGSLVYVEISPLSRGIHRPCALIDQTITAISHQVGAHSSTHRSLLYNNHTTDVDDDARRGRPGEEDTPWKLNMESC